MRPDCECDIDTLLPGLVGVTPPSGPSVIPHSFAGSDTKLIEFDDVQRCTFSGSERID
jgi:hypothetical protein